jgi:hypothetical protein
VPCFGEQVGERHREAAGERRRDELLRFGSVAVFESRGERVRPSKHSVANIDLARAGENIPAPVCAAVPHCHVGLLIRASIFEPLAQRFDLVFDIWLADMVDR